MNIIFLASSAAKEAQNENYKKIIKLIEKGSHIVNDSYVSHNNSPADQSDISLNVLESIISDLKKADCLFIEATLPSFTMGYFTSLALQLGKSVVILISSKNYPIVFKFLEKINDKVQIIKYDDIHELERGMKAIFSFINDSQDTRFNFFLSPSLSNYLDWISKTRKIPRSVYLRNLLDQEMSHFESEV